MTFKLFESPMGSKDTVLGKFLDICALRRSRIVISTPILDSYRQYLQNSM